MRGRVIGYGLTVAALTGALVTSGGMAAATEPSDPPAVYEVALYLYKKLDSTEPAAWANSGVQQLVTYQAGSDWFTTFPGELPDGVCGPGWAVQQDKVKHDGTFVWPETIEYPHDNIGWPPIYAAQHSELSDFVAVPDCVTEPTPEPTRTTEPTPLPPLEPPTVERLPETGLEGWFWGLLALAAGLTVAGWWAVRRSHDSSTTTTGEQ